MVDGEGGLPYVAARLVFAALVDLALAAADLFAAFFDFPDFVAIALPSYSQVSDRRMVSEEPRLAIHECPYRRSKPEPKKMLLKFPHHTPIAGIVKNFIQAVRRRPDKSFRLRPPLFDTIS
ncbi:MAG TPA: hypothetical protein VKA60_07910 [Blastocatellia bacterium]|nr:hypothetical protein [Blastocatellia bacterium]